MEKVIDIEMNKRISSVSKNCVQINNELIENDIHTFEIVSKYLLNVSTKNKQVDDDFKDMIKTLQKKYKNDNISYDSTEKYYMIYSILHRVYIYSLKVYGAEDRELKDNIEQLFREYCKKIKEPKEIKNIPNDEEDINNKTMI